MELQRRAVHAVALASGDRTVIEDMAEMPAAPRAMHFGAMHQQAAIFRRADSIRLRRIEAGPSAAAFVFRLRIEQGLAAAGADKHPFALFTVQRTGAGRLGAVLAQ